MGQGRTSSSLSIWSIASAVVAVAIGFAIVQMNVSVPVIILCISATVIVTPVIRRVAVGGPSGWLEPVVWAGATMVVIYVMRPAALLIFDQMGRFGYDLEPNFNKVLILTLVGAASLYFGYFALGGARLVQRIPRPSDQLDQTTVLLLSYGTIALGFALFAIGAIRSGTPVAEGMVHGFRIDPEQSSAYFYLAPMMALPAALLIYRTGSTTGSRGLKMSAWLIAVPIAAILAPAGSRFTTLYFVAPFFIYVMLRDNWRLRLIPFAATSLLVLSFVMATQDFQPGEQTVGSVASGTRSAFESPRDTFESLLTGPTTAEFDALIIEQELVPSALPFSPGNTITSTLAQPIPRLLWPNKPYPADSHINAVAFRHLTAGQSRMGEAFSPIGGFWYDSGWFGVVIGMALLGWALRMLWRYFALHRNNDIVRILYSISLPLIVVLMRGNIPDTLGRTVFFVIPLLVIVWLAGVAPRSTGAQSGSRLLPGIAANT